jgi:hypothetical protein
MSTLWPWVAAVGIAVFGFITLNKVIPAEAAHKKLARIGAALVGLGIGLIVPAYRDHIHPPIEVAAAALGAVGTVLYLLSGRKRG